MGNAVKDLGKKKTLTHYISTENIHRQWLSFFPHFIHKYRIVLLIIENFREILSFRCLVRQFGVRHLKKIIFQKFSFYQTTFSFSDNM